MIPIAISGLVSAVFIALMCAVAGQGRVTSIPADDDHPSDYQQSMTAGHVETVDAWRQRTTDRTYRSIQAARRTQNTQEI